MKQALQDAPPGLKKLLRSQFPRWKLIGELVANDVKKQAEDPEKLKPPPDPSQLTPDAQPWDQISWVLLLHLWKEDFDWNLCARRGCGKPGTISCGDCQEVVYCSEVCSKKFVTTLIPFISTNSHHIHFATGMLRNTDYAALACRLSKPSRPVSHRPKMKTAHH